METGELVSVGRIVAPHGVRGDLRMRPDFDHPEIFGTVKEIFIGNTPHRVLSCRPHKNIFILRLADVTDRNTAEALVGEGCALRAETLPELPEGEYYYDDLLGLTVVTDDGETVGELTEILQTGANDVYTVTDGDGEEILLPAIPDVILKIDLSSKTMTVKLPEWE